MMLGIFAMGVILGFLEFGVTYSATELEVDGDEIAERYRALEAAKQQSSSVSPAQLMLHRNSDGRRDRRGLKQAEADVQFDSDGSRDRRGLEQAAADVRFEWKQVARLALFMEVAGDHPGDLFAGDALVRLASLEDEFAARPRVANLCRRSGGRFGDPGSTRPRSLSNCTGFFGPLHVLRAPRVHVSRYEDFEIFVGGAVPLHVQSGSLAAAMTSQGDVNMSHLFHLLPAEVSDPPVHPAASGTGVTCASGRFTSEGNATRLLLEGCGPLTRCCSQCAQSDDESGVCVDMPLCATLETELAYQSLGVGPQSPMAERADVPASFLASARALRGLMAGEGSCESSELRASVGDMLELDYRAGATSQLVRMLETLEVGFWHPDDAETGAVGALRGQFEAELAQVVERDFMPLVHICTHAHTYACMHTHTHARRHA